MSKAVLVMDMPKSCTKCEFTSSDNKDCFCSRCKKDNDDYVLRGTKPDWCPLHSLPEKREEAKEPLATRYYRAEGWNDCLDEITGGAE